MRLGNGDSRVGYENFITIESSLFLNNAAVGGASGGAIYIDSSTGESNLTVKQTCFRNNSAGGPGGAICAWKAPDGNLHVHSANFIKLEESCFVNNLANAQGGAISFANRQSNQNITIKGSLFTSNNSTYCGGAISLENETPGNYLTINDTTFTENVAISPGGGEEA